MWRIDRLETRLARLDFSSSGGGQTTVTQWVDGGTVIANALELTDWRPPHIQLLVCASCGSVGCETGGWLQPLRCGSFALWVPVESGLGAEPPNYFRTKGALLTSQSVFEQLMRQTKGGAFGDLAPLTGQSLVSLFQFEAPRRALGESSQLEFRADRFLNVTSGDVVERGAQLVQVLQRIGTPERMVQLRERVPEEEVVSFIVDDDEQTEWSPLVVGSADTQLALGPELVAELMNK